MSACVQVYMLTCGKLAYWMRQVISRHSIPCIEKVYTLVPFHNLFACNFRFSYLQSTWHFSWAVEPAVLFFNHDDNQTTQSSRHPTRNSLLLRANQNAAQSVQRIPHGIASWRPWASYDRTANQTRFNAESEGIMKHTGEMTVLETICKEIDAAVKRDKRRLKLRNKPKPTHTQCRICGGKLVKRGDYFRCLGGDMVRCGLSFKLNQPRKEGEGKWDTSS